MANKTYVTKGYSTYTNIPSIPTLPAQRAGYESYEHDRKHSGGQYVVETKTLERVRAPTNGYTDYVGSPSKVELLKEYVHSPTLSGTPKYAFNDGGRHEDYEPNYVVKYENSSPPVSPNKYGHGYFSDESKSVHPGHNGHNGHNGYNGPPGPSYVRTGNITGPNKSWLTAGPPATEHRLTTSTNNINEALGMLEESVFYSPRADPRRRGVLDDLSTRAQPQEPHRRYAKPAFGAKRNDGRSNFASGNAIDSHEAMRRYRGSYIP